MRRTLPLFAGLLTVVMVLAGCGSPAPAPAPGTAPSGDGAFPVTIPTAFGDVTVPVRMRNVDGDRSNAFLSPAANAAAVHCSPSIRALCDRAGS